LSMPSETPGGAPNLTRGMSAAAAVAAPCVSDTLLDRCRALWDQGDWPALAAYGVAMIEAHPQRASLALMIAMAHQALAQDAQTRLFVTLAHQWGCERRLVARALLAGVHNTLGRAGAASGTRRMQTLQHFTEALAASGTGNAALRLQERLRHQLGTMGLDSEVSSLLEVASDSSIFATRAPAPSREEFDALNRSSRQILARLKEQSQQLVAVRRSIETAVRKEAVNTMAQLEAHASLQHYLGGGQLSPELHGWPVSPDFAVMLIGMVEANDYDLVIEFGSGTSTLLMALALARTATRRGRSFPAVQVAFEHLELFFRQTRSVLERADIADAVQLELAPLQPWTSAQGTDYMFYACQRRLAAIVRAAPGPISRALVLVDGPPSATGTHARYPALPIVLTLLPGVAMDVLLDDHDRPDEQQVSAMWVADLQTAGRHVEVSTPDLEKGACLVKLDAT
jgi:hypothetical protein